MKVNDILSRLITLPSNFQSVGNMSIYDLLKETGYFDIHEKISVESIRNTLAKSPEYVEDWIIYSEDKRSAFGWYFKQQDNKRYVVGLLSGDRKVGNEYGNRLEACAIFIKNEIESIRAL